jgi:lipopolysaccharide/colanic/teichoic acid biosynthesis glycosyltransferase
MVKRLIDFTATLLGLLVISPVLVVLWIMVRIKHGSPVLFCQTRPGLYGRPFTMVNPTFCESLPYSFASRIFQF